MEEQIISLRFHRACGAALLMLTTLAGVAFAQSATGSIRGVVVDDHTGTPVPHARITVRDTGTGAARQLTTDARGRFDAPGSPVGVYEITAASPGYAVRRQDRLPLQVGETISLRFELRRSPLSDTITLLGVRSPIEPSRTAVSALVSAEVMTNLPTRSRNAVDFTLLAPGIVDDARTGGYSFVGQPSTRTNVVVDGTDGHLPLFGLPFHYGQDTVQSFIVNTSSYAAEYGRAAGGIISVATKSGTNRFSGTAFDYFGNTQFGGVLGGPIVADRHFFFGGYEGQRFEETLDGGDAWERDHDTFLVKTNHALTDAIRLSLRYNDHDAMVNGADAAARSFNGTLAAPVGPNVVNEVRVQRAGHDHPVLFVGSLDRSQIADTLMAVVGAHTVKAGIDILHDEVGGSRVHDLSLFVQDDWRVAEAVTASAGVRFDRQSFPDAPSDDLNTSDAAPRLGLAWAPIDGRVVVRGGYGVFYGRRQAGSTIRDAAPRAQQASAGVDYEWMRHTSMTVNYLFADGEWAAVDSRYQGVTVDLHHRFEQGYQYRFAYTLGKVEEDGAPALTDVRHRVAATAIYDSTQVASLFGGLVEDVLENWTVSAVWALQSGQPETTIESVHTGRWLSRRTSIDPRIARHVDFGDTRRLTVIWEAFNLLNSVDADGVNPLFGRFARTAAPRVTQLAVRFSF